MRRFFVIAFLFLFTVPATSQTVITGKLLGADGKPMVQADITRVSNLARFPRDRITSFPVDENGVFSFKVSAPNLYRLWFSGAYHQNFELTVYVDKADTIRLNVQLAPYHFIKKSQEIMIGIVTGWKDEELTVPYYKYFKVKPDSFGNYMVKWKNDADTVAYKVSGITEEEQSVHGTQFDYLYPHRKRNYYSVLKKQPDDSVTISLNLSDYPELKPQEAKHTFLKAPIKTSHRAIGSRFLCHLFVFRRDRHCNDSQQP